MRGLRGSAAVCALGALARVAGCGGGGERQDADEPSRATCRRRRRGGVPRAAAPRRAGDDAHARAQRGLEDDPEPRGDRRRVLARAPSSRASPTPRGPVWIIDDGPRGGVTAYTNTWALGRVTAGRDEGVRLAGHAGQGGQPRDEVPRRRRPRRQGQGGARRRRARPRAPSTSTVSREPDQSRVDPDTGEVVARRRRATRAAARLRTPRAQREGAATLAPNRACDQPRRRDVPRKIDAGEVLAALGGLLVFVALFLRWFGDFTRLGGVRGRSTS